MMFGYFVFSGEMGSRIQPNPAKQPRCGHHVETPFLYIAKTGPGRQFLCPFYKCKEKGDVVANVVNDEEVALPADPLAGRSKVQVQEAREMSIFQAFVVAAELPLDHGTARNAKPPFPDIGCTVSGKPHWFELGEIIPREVAEKVNPKRRAVGGGFSISQDSPFTQVVEKKTSSTYETQGAPVDLVLHFDLRLGSKSVVLGQIQQQAELLRSLVMDGLFQRVWIYDDWTKTVVWSRPKSQTSGSEELNL